MLLYLITQNSRCSYLRVELHIWMLHCSYVAKYWRGKLLANLANGSQFAKILPNQSLPLKNFEHRGEVINQFITAKSLVSIHLPIF